MNDWLDYKGSGSILQRTALGNKLSTINNKYKSTRPKFTRVPSGISIDAFNTLIDEIN